MSFPSYISNIFRLVIVITLGWEIGYLLNHDLGTDRVYKAAVKIAVCFTCIISFINDNEKMLVINNKGLLLETMVLDERTLPEKLSFIYIIIALIYNPILTPFYSYTYWTIAHIMTILFLSYKVWYFKKQFRKSK